MLEAPDPNLRRVSWRASRHDRLHRPEGHSSLRTADAHEYVVAESNVDPVRVLMPYRCLPFSLVLAGTCRTEACKRAVELASESGGVHFAGGGQIIHDNASPGICQSPGSRTDQPCVRSEAAPAARLAPEWHCSRPA